MIRAGTRAAMLLSVACAEPLSTEQLLDRIMARTGAPLGRRDVEHGMRCLRRDGLLTTVRPGVRGNHMPAGLYTISPAGEAELDRLFMEAHL